jgi:hypothetical protein
LNAVEDSGEKNWDALDKLWCEVVGGAQRLLPIPIVDEYCSNLPFDPIPPFKTRPTPAQGKQQF